MNKVAVYYIATSEYINFFNAFMGGLNNFFPNVKKKIILITDKDDIDISIYSSDDIEVVKRHIDHYYWPIPTLFKMFYMEKFFANDCDYHFYCNANIVFSKKVNFEKEYDMYFTKHYLSDRLSLYVINNGNNNNCIIPPNWAKCHISQNEIPNNAKYCQGCFFGGKTDKVLTMLKEINCMIKEDLKHNIIPIWHDETYLNRFLLDKYWKNNLIGDVKLLSIYDYATLLDKNKYFNKFEI